VPRSVAVLASWLGFPIVAAVGGIPPGPRSLDGPHRLVALAAVVLGVLVLVLSVLATAFPAGDED